MPVRMLYAWLLRSSDLCAGNDCKYKQQQAAKFRCEDCPLTILDERRFNTLPGVIFKNAMAEYNDIQIGFQKTVDGLSCLEFIGMVVIHNELSKWRDQQSEAKIKAMKGG